MKHNKKRNTAFIYEALVRQITDSIVNKDEKRKTTAIKIVKKHFKSGSLLRRDLDCYRSLYENDSSIPTERILKEVKLAKRLIDPTGLFKAQTSIINDINKELGPATFNVFVPNYKTLATISQIFSDNTSPKEKVLLENTIIQLEKLNESENQMKPIDNLVFSSFVKKFNQQYSTTLLEEQKTLLTHYITSFVDNSIELKMFLNEELGRIKTELRKAKTSDFALSNDSLNEMLDKTINKLDSLSSVSKIDESTIKLVLKTQQLVKEINDNASNS